MVKVKICGITNARDARVAIVAGADFLGFNFYQGSSRFVTPASARRIVKRLPKHIVPVGVFVNEKPARVVRIARQVGLAFAQLHGDEAPESIAEVADTVPVIKAIRVKSAASLAELKRFKCAGALLLDGFDKKSRGGTGKTFDWKLARAICKGRRIFLAGGLTPENAAEAIRVVRPYAIDVCSGVESASPRKKDAAKIAALMAAVRGTAQPPRKRSKRK